MKTYKGHEIWPVEYAEKKAAGFRWYVQTYHETGGRWGSQHCPHFRSLAMAREWINEHIATDAVAAASIPA